MIAYVHQTNLMLESDLVAMNFLQQKLKPKSALQLMLDAMVMRRKAQKLLPLTFGQQMGLLREWFQPKSDGTSHAAKLAQIQWDSKQETLKDVMAQIMHANIVAYPEVDSTPWGIVEFLNKVVLKDFQLVKYVRTRMDQKQIPMTYKAVLEDAVDYMIRNTTLQSAKQVMGQGQPQQYQNQNRPYYNANYRGWQGGFRGNRGGGSFEYTGRGRGQYSSRSPERKTGSPPPTSRRNLSPTGSVRSGMGTDPRGGNMQSYGPRKCFNCGDTSHIARDCKRPPQNTSQSGSRFIPLNTGRTRGLGSQVGRMWGRSGPSRGMGQRSASSTTLAET